MAPTSPAERPAAVRPAALRVAVVLVAVQAAALLVLAVVTVVEALRGSVSSWVFAAIETAFFAGWGLSMLAAARGLLRGRRWARSPLVVTELLLLVPVGLLTVRPGQPVAGAAVVAVSAVALVALLAPSVGATLE